MENSRGDADDASGNEMHDGPTRIVNGLGEAGYPRLFNARGPR